MSNHIIQHEYRIPQDKATTFNETESMVHLECLFGMSTLLDEDRSISALANTFFSLDTSIGILDSQPPRLKVKNFTASSVYLVWEAFDGRLELTSEWTFCQTTGIWSRKDKIKNTGIDPITIYRCLSRFIFNAHEYELYSQNNMWCLENEGDWEKFTYGERVFSSKGGRTTQGGVPFIGIRNSIEEGLALHVVPQGNWAMKVRGMTFGNLQLVYPFLEVGLSDRHLRFVLEVDESFTLPEILIHSLPCGEVHGATARFHQYVLKHLITAPETVPVIYNTWFYDFQHFTIEGLRRQLAAAKHIGCDIFVIDAGWFGSPESSWWDKTGDWIEMPDGPFGGNMNSFADEVRSEGLGFGLWIEPVRISTHSMIYQENPQWFKPSSEGFYYPDLMRDEVYAYLLGEIQRLIEKYNLKWMKIDFNAELGIDDSGMEFYGYYSKWYELLDELRARFPHMFFEGCDSGGMHLDLKSLSHMNGHFMSDSVNPTDVVRMSQGAMLRLPPGLLTKWSVIRGAGHNIPQYIVPLSKAPEHISTPSGAHWGEAIVHDPHFVIRANMIGFLGFSGDLASVSDDILADIKGDVDFYKEWASFIVGSSAHLLTAPKHIADRDGWVIFQLNYPSRKEKLVFVYRLDDPHSSTIVRLHNLDHNVTYSIRSIDELEAARSLTGSALMEDGLKVSLSSKLRSSIYVIS
jgi:alpha-galactosidase